MILNLILILIYFECNIKKTNFKVGNHVQKLKYKSITISGSFPKRYILCKNIKVEVDIYNPAAKANVK